jgi:hypothetical protein
MSDTFLSFTQTNFQREFRAFPCRIVVSHKHDYRCDFGTFIRTTPGPLSYISPSDCDEVKDGIRPSLRLLLENPLHYASADTKFSAYL